MSSLYLEINEALAHVILSSTEISYDEGICYIQDPNLKDYQTSDYMKEEKKMLRLIKTHFPEVWKQYNLEYKIEGLDL